MCLGVVLWWVSGKKCFVSDATYLLYCLLPICVRSMYICQVLALPVTIQICRSGAYAYTCQEFAYILGAGAADHDMDIYVRSMCIHTLGADAAAHGIYIYICVCVMAIYILGAGAADHDHRRELRRRVPRHAHRAGMHMYVACTCSMHGACACVPVYL